MEKGKKLILIGLIILVLTILARKLIDNEILTLLLMCIGFLLELKGFLIKNKENK
ncbi:MAG: hypothetical protein RR832_01505 [Bacilli bacterium]